ncbi:MAG: 50S ribosomal protein L25 [Pseudomonadota bacterium]|nr:50S ribosomal protein L25 [Pseudomonadota bacterium]
MKIKAEIRESKGTRACRQLMHLGMYPAVLYGHGKQARMLQVDKSTMDVFMKRHAVKTQIFSVEVGSESQDVLVKEIKRSNATNKIQHIDFYEVSRNKELQVSIPVLFQHEETSVGVKEGGVIDHVMTEIAIKVLPRNLPESIDVDIANLEIGDAIHLSDLTLPKGVSLQRPVADDYNPIIVSIHAPKVVEDQPEPESMSEGVTEEASEDSQEASTEDSGQAAE